LDSCCWSLSQRSLSDRLGPSRDLECFALYYLESLQG
jgi:hypothetical protein